MDRRDITLGYIGLGKGQFGDNVAPFDRLFKNKVNLVSDKDAFKKCQAIVVWGGIDIHPSMYGQKAHPSSQVYNDKEPSNRDQIEWHMMREAHAEGAMIIGICRGAQMLCVFAGGSLYQNVNGHNSGHSIQTYNGKTFYANAQHHQMMNLDNTNHDILAWPNRTNYSAAPLDPEKLHALSSIYERETVGTNEPGTHLLTKVEPEIVYFPEVKGFAIQAHPEWSEPTSDFVEFCLEEINKRIKE